MNTKTLEFWFSYGSTYTYLTVARLGELATSKGVVVDWKPFILRVITRELGMPKGPFGSNPAKLGYMWRDVERRAARHGLRYKKPSIYPVDSQSTAHVGLLAAREGWCAEFTRLVFHWNFVEGRPIGVEGNLEGILRELGKNPEEVIAKAQSDEIKDAMIRQTDEAKSLGIFGSPSFIIAGELFWGDDRLEDALAWCLSH